MKLDNIKFNKDEMPEEVSVTMSIKEALWIVSIAGKQRGFSPHNGIYTCLSENVFNRYWEDGVKDANRFYQIQIPPIIYEEEY